MNLQSSTMSAVAARSCFDPIAPKSLHRAVADRFKSQWGDHRMLGSTHRLLNKIVSGIEDGGDLVELSVTLRTCLGFIEDALFCADDSAPGRKLCEARIAVETSSLYVQELLHRQMAARQVTDPAAH